MGHVPNGLIKSQGFSRRVSEAMYSIDDSGWCMYGYSIQDEFAVYCQAKGTDPRQELGGRELSGLGLRDFLHILENEVDARRGRDSERLRVHFRALEFDRHQVARKVDWGTDQQSAIRELLVGLPAGEREQVACLIDAYMAGTVRPGAFLQQNDPALAAATSEHAGLIIAQTARGAFQDQRLDWHAATKYARLVRCYGDAFEDHQPLHAWATTGRQVDAQALWDFLCEQAMWAEYDKEFLTDFVAVLNGAGCSAESLNTWASQELVQLVQELAHTSTTYDVAEPLATILGWLPNMEKGMSRAIFDCALAEALTFSTKLQQTCSHLPHLQEHFQRALASSDSQVRKQALRWLAHSPRSDMARCLDEAARTESDIPNKSRLLAARASLANHTRPVEHSLPKLLAELTKMGMCTGLPDIFKRANPPEVRWRQDLQVRLGTHMSPDAVRGVLAGVYSFRFQHQSAELQFLAQHVDPFDWNVLCNHGLGYFHGLCADAAEMDHMSHSPIKSTLTQPAGRLLRAYQNTRQGRSPFHPVFDGRGLLEFAVHGDPVSTAQNLWSLLTCRLWHLEEVSSQVVWEIVRTITRRRDPAAYAMLLDLETVWHLVLPDTRISEFLPELAYETSGNAEDFEWNAVNHLGLDMQGQRWFIDDARAWHVRVDGEFTVHGPPSTAPGAPLQLTWQHSHGVADFMYEATRTRLRLRNLLRNMAALNQPMTVATWKSRILNHPTARLCAMNVVWLALGSQGPKWFTVSENGVLLDQNGGIVLLGDGEVYVASCVNTPAGVINHWDAVFGYGGRHYILGQFRFATAETRQLQDGYWRLGGGDVNSLPHREVLMSDVDAWAYCNGFSPNVEYANQVGSYAKKIGPDLLVIADFHGSEMPVDEGVETILTKFACMDSAPTSPLSNPYIHEAVMQQLYCDFMSLYSGEFWPSPPGKRCVR